MAETVHLYLKLNGVTIQGESTQTSLGREDSIECIHFVNEVKTARQAGSGQATGRRQYEPILIRKRIDKSSPLLAKGLAQNQVAEGVFKFFRPNPSGDGTTEHFFTIDIKQGRVSYIKLYVEDVLDPDTSTRPPLEEVSFVFHTIKWTYEPGGVEYQDTWNAQAKGTTASVI